MYDNIWLRKVIYGYIWLTRKLTGDRKGMSIRTEDVVKTESRKVE